MFGSEFESKVDRIVARYPERKAALVFGFSFEASVRTVSDVALDPTTLLPGENSSVVPHGRCQNVLQFRSMHQSRRA